MVDASQTESLISPNGIVEFVESNKSALHDSSRDKRRIEVCFSGNPMAAVQRTIQVPLFGDPKQTVPLKSGDTPLASSNMFFYLFF